jgi:hypothetical protein
MIRNFSFGRHVFDAVIYFNNGMRRERGDENENENETGQPPNHVDTC